jgi:hypothetical protein
LAGAAPRLIWTSSCRIWRGTGRNPEILVSNREQFLCYDITRRMQHPVHDEKLSKEEALATTRDHIHSIAALP